MNLVSFAGKNNRPKASQQPEYLSAVKELELVMAKGGEGIDKAMVLGKNIGRTDDMIVAPMGPGEKLFQVPHGRHKLYRTTAQHAAAQILRASSPNDVSLQQPALFDDGTRRPAMTDTPFEKCILFADNIICFTTDHDSAKIYDFFGLFGLSTHGKLEPKQRISGKGTSKSGEVKIATANIPLEDIDFILMVNEFGKIYDLKKPLTLVKWTEQECTPRQQLKMTFAAIATAVEMVAKKEIIFVEIDLTMDLPGTIHMREFTDIVKAAGHTVIEDSKCGLQCIKFTMADHPEVIFKFYNKVPREIHLVRST
jgi:hypothetical protein